MFPEACLIPHSSFSRFWLPCSFPPVYQQLLVSLWLQESPANGIIEKLHWRRVWMLLKHNFLFYFKDEHQDHPSTILLLDNFVVSRESDEGAAHAYSMCLPCAVSLLFPRILWDIPFRLTVRRDDRGTSLSKRKKAENWSSNELLDGSLCFPFFQANCL